MQGRRSSNPSLTAAARQTENIILKFKELLKVRLYISYILVKFIFLILIFGIVIYSTTYLKNEREVIGGSGPAPGFSSNFACSIFCIRSRSEGEQRDCEIPTISAGSGIAIRSDSSELPVMF